MSVHILTAACGDYPMADRYVMNLYRGFREHFYRAFTMHVVTDIPAVVDAIENEPPFCHCTIVAHKPVRNVWGWWNLMELYRPDAPWSDGHVIMVGLDTVIRGDVYWLVRHWPTYMMPVRQSLGLKGAFDGTYADGVVCLPPDMHYNEVWETYMREVMPAETHAMKRSWPMHPYVTEVINRHYAEKPHFWQQVCPGKLCSYREPSRKLNEPTGPLVIFHGHPRPHETTSEAPWIAKYFPIGASESESLDADG